MLTDFTGYQYTDNGMIWNIIECQLDVDLDEDNELDIHAVYVPTYAKEWGDNPGRVNLIGPDADRDMKSTGIAILEQAQGCDKLLAKVMEHEGVSYRGMGSNDPDGRYVGATL